MWAAVQFNRIFFQKSRKVDFLIFSLQNVVGLVFENFISYLDLWKLKWKKILPVAIFLSQASRKIPSRIGNNASIGADGAPELLPLPPAGGPPQLCHPAPATSQVSMIV